MIHTSITYKTCNLDPIELQTTDYKAYSPNTFTKQIYPFQPLGYTEIVEWILYIYIYDACVLFHIYSICTLCGSRLFKFKL